MRRFSRLPCRLRRAALIAVLALAHAPVAAARPRLDSCLGIDNGPCETAEAFSFLVGSAGPPGVILTNFGLLYPGERAGRWEVTCDDTFAFTTPDRVRRAPDGRLFAASNEGLLFTTDGCSWTTATGDIAGKIVFDVAFDRQSPATVWALGNLPRQLFLSQDGGRSFRVKQSFPDGLTVVDLVVAPSDGKHIYLTGRGLQMATPFAVSVDAGETFIIGNLSDAATPRARTSLDFLAISPDDPLVMYFAVFDPVGDQLWQTTDGGKSVRPVLTVTDEDALAGFTFGATSSVLYLGSANPIPLPGKPRARLHISRDAGKTWESPRPVDQSGPTFRCLAFAAGKLYACGLGEPAGDPFVLGVSPDEGRTWAPEMRFAQLDGVRRCVRDACPGTESWLCTSYQQCPPGVTPPPPPGVGVEEGEKDAAVAVDADAGAAGATRGDAGKGCSCEIGAAPQGTAVPWLLAVTIALSFGRFARRPERR